MHDFAVQRLELDENQLDSLSKQDILIKWRNMNSSEGGARKVRVVRILVIIRLLFELLNMFCHDSLHGIMVANGLL